MSDSSDKKTSENVTVLVPLTRNQAVIIQLSLLETMLNLSRDGSNIISIPAKEEIQKDIAEVGDIMKLLSARFGKVR